MFRVPRLHLFLLLTLPPLLFGGEEGPGIPNTPLAPPPGPSFSNWASTSPPPYRRRSRGPRTVGSRGAPQWHSPAQPPGPHPPRWVPLRDPARRGPQHLEGTCSPQAPKPSLSPLSLHSAPLRGRMKGSSAPGVRSQNVPSRGEPLHMPRGPRACDRPGDPSQRRSGNAAYCRITRSCALSLRISSSSAPGPPPRGTTT